MEFALNKTIVAVLLVVLVVIALAVLVWKNQKLVAMTDKEEYSEGETIKIKIRSYFLNKEVCFSSCYPYFLEKQARDWKPYRYEQCFFPDRIERCVKPGELVAFAIPLPSVSDGLHRISIPICQGCHIGEEFRENIRFYSNPFRIK